MIFTDSFDHYQTADIEGKWDLAADGRIVGGGRHDSCVEILGMAEWGIRRFVPSYSTWILGFGFRSATANARQIVYLMDGEVPQVILMSDPDDGLLLYGVGGDPIDTAVFFPVLGTWYFIEIKVTISHTGAYEVRIDGETVMSGIGDLQATANATADNIGFGNANYYPSILFDDLYICDGSGTKNNDFLGPVHVVALYPNGVGAHSDWQPLDGTNYQCVQEQSGDYPDGDSTYVSSQSAADIDTYGFDNVPYPPGGENTVAGVQVNLWCRQTIPDGRTIAPVVRSSELDYEGTTVPLIVGYEDEHEAFDKEPNTDTDWTITNVNAAQFGMKLVT